MKRQAPVRPRQIRLLATVGRLVVATTHQINRCLYQPGSQITTGVLLKELEDEWGFLRHGFLPSYLPRGSSPYLWKLTNKGFRLLLREGLARDELVLPSDNGASRHAVLANEAVVRALELSRHNPTIQLNFRAEPLLRRRPVLGVVPDAWLQLRRSPHGEQAYCFEWDFGTIRARDRILSRFKAYIRLNDSPTVYRDAFQSEHLVSVWVTESPQRRDFLRSLCKQLLAALHRDDLNDLFVFGSAADRTNGEEFYFGEHWYAAVSDQSTSLLPKEWHDARQAG